MPAPDFFPPFLLPLFSSLSRTATYYCYVNARMAGKQSIISCVYD